MLPVLKPLCLSWCTFEVSVPVCQHELPVKNRLAWLCERNTSRATCATMYGFIETCPGGSAMQLCLCKLL